MARKHIILDLDGTLIDSKNEILSTYKKVFDDILPDAYPELQRLNYGLSINDLLRGVYRGENDKIVGAKKLFASIYDNSEFEETTLYEGVVTTLRDLVEYGAALYIATNKRYAPTKRILELKGLSHYFAGVVANEMENNVQITKRQTISLLKSSFSFQEGYMVGDSCSDIRAGNEEQLETVAVSYGYEEQEALTLINPTIIIDRFEKLYTFVTREK